MSTIPSDHESNSADDPVPEPKPHAPPTETHTARMIRGDVRRAVAARYPMEVQSLLRTRYFWKRGGDWCEAIAKGLTGVSAVLAFAASAETSQGVTDALAFSSGCVGTFGLVLLTYSSYATRESRQRTAELNNVLNALGITPMPELASSESQEPDV